MKFVQKSHLIPKVYQIEVVSQTPSLLQMKLHLAVQEQPLG